MYLNVEKFIVNISDVITNSSSEVFCIIDSENDDLLKQLEEKLHDVFGYNGEYEIDTVIEKSERGVEMIIPHYYDDSVRAFYKYGLEALLDVEFKEKRNDLTVNYDINEGF